MVSLTFNVRQIAELYHTFINALLDSSIDQFKHQMRRESANYDRNLGFYVSWVHDSVWDGFKNWVTNAGFLLCQNTDLSNFTWWVRIPAGLLP